MKIQVRKVLEKIEEWENPATHKVEKIKIPYENGFVEEMEINLSDISAFTGNKSTRLIGIGKNLYPLTMKSWKEVKKTLSKSEVGRRFNLEKQN